MQDDEIRRILEENLKPQREINGIILTIIGAIIPIIATAAGKLTYDIALLLILMVFVVYLGWVLSLRKKSIIDWNKFYDILVRMKALEEYKEDKNTNISLEVYNNYITFLYLVALYEGKENFAKELWDKARISQNIR